MCLEITCENEGNESVSYCQEDPTFILQGTIVFVMGMSILFDLVIEFICRDATSTQRSPRLAFVSIVLLPVFWLLLAITAVSSKSYYCTNMPCIAKHMLYPVLVTLRNPDIWRALLVFGSAMGSALAVLFTFWCMLLSLAAIAMIMLQGKFQTRDYSAVMLPQTASSMKWLSVNLVSGQPVF